jgi:hypothetical protein
MEHDLEDNSSIASVNKELEAIDQDPFPDVYKRMLSVVNIQQFFGKRTGLFGYRALGLRGQQGGLPSRMDCVKQIWGRYG